MNFYLHDIQRIKKALSLELPGEKAQLQMAPEKTGLFEVQQDPQLAAVMILLYPVNGILHTLFIRRPEYPGVHGGQISFPGGKTEFIDTNLADTALRESFEEVGVLTSDIEIIGQLTKLYIPVSNFDVYPHVGFIPYKPNWKIDNTEVAYLIEVPLNFFFDLNIRMKEKWKIRGKDVVVPFFNINGNKLWGATAMVLNEFLSMISDLIEKQV